MLVMSRSTEQQAMSLFTRHLDSVGETYWQHLGHALSFAVTLAWATIACFVHALVRFAFEKTGSECIRRLHDRMVVNRHRLTPGADERVAERAARA